MMTIRAKTGFLSRPPCAALLLLAALATCLAALPVNAADFEAGMRYAVVSPHANEYDGGSLDIASSGGFAATAEVFASDGASVHFAATFVNPEAILFPTVPPPSDIDLTTLGIDAYSLTGRWYFLQQSRVRPFGGAGAAYLVIGDLDDRFGDAIKVVFDPKWAPVAEVGTRYQLSRRIALDVSVSWLPLSATSNVVRNDDPRVVLPAEIELDPITFSAGAAWRF